MLSNLNIYYLLDTLEEVMIIGYAEDIETKKTKVIVAGDNNKLFIVDESNLQYKEKFIDAFERSMNINDKTKIAA